MASTEFPRSGKKGKRKEKKGKKNISLFATPGLAESSRVLLKLAFKTIAPPTQTVLLRVAVPPGPPLGLLVGGKSQALKDILGPT